MKIYLTIVVFYLIFMPCSGQTLLDDVLKLRSHIMPSPADPDRPIFDEATDNVKTAAKIMTKYIPGGPNSDQSTEIIREITNGNSFIQKYFRLDPGMDASLSSPVDVNNVEQFASTSSSKSPFISTLIWGFSDYLVSRTKQELKRAYFDKFSEKVKNQKFLKEFFPVTKSALETIGTDIYHYEKYFNSLQESFRQDFGLMPNSMADYLRSGSSDYDDLEAKLVADFLDSGQKILNSKSIVEISEFLRQNSMTALNDGSINGRTRPGIYNTRSVLVLFDVVLSSLIEESGTSNFVSISDFKSQILDDSVSLDLYLGLTYQLIKNYDIKMYVAGNAKSLAAKLLELNKPGNNADKNSFISSLKSLISEANAIDDIIGKLDDKDTYPSHSQIRTDLYYNYIKSGSNIIRAVSRLLSNNSAVLDKIDEGLRLVESGLRIPLSASRKRYSNVIIDVNNILIYALNSPEKKYLKQLLSAGNFMAALASSETSADVSAVIEAYALPVGSYIDKRRAKYTWSISSYVGPVGGVSELSVSKDNSPFGYGLTAPLGIEYSRSGSKGKKSTSLMLYPFDLGAPVAYRFTNDEITSDLDLQLDHIFAPGVQFAFSTKGLMTLNINCQLGPSLKNVSTTGLDVVDVKSLRYGFSVTADLPVFSIKRVERSDDED